MTILFHLKPGQILLCDFSPGFKEPEMVKMKRPVVILTGPIKGRANLVTVVPLSHAEPKPQQAYHYKIPKSSLPMLGNFQDEDSWLKGDMLYTVGFHRLNRILLGRRGPDGKRMYFDNRLGREQMTLTYQCVMHGLNLSHLAKHV